MTRNETALRLVDGALPFAGLGLLLIGATAVPLALPLALNQRMKRGSGQPRGYRLRGRLTRFASSRQAPGTPAGTWRKSARPT